LKNIYILFQIVILSAFSVFAKSPLKISELTIGGISIRDDTTKIKGLLGKPDSMTSEYFIVDDDTLKAWYYKKGINFDFIKDIKYSKSFQLAGFTITSSNFNTSFGLKIGDNKSQIFKAFGKPDRIADGYYIYQEQLDVPLDLSFKIVKNVIQEISIYKEYSTD
jgi:hypothetical protein